MSWIQHPLIRGLEMGSGPWFAAQLRMIEDKPLVRRCYDLWYERMLADAGAARTIVELGSGACYVKRIGPDVITTDVTAGVADAVVDGRQLPFRAGSVGALLLAHVFHHIPDVRLFFREAERVLEPGGVISMVECTNTPFARFFFGRIHPEPFLPDAETWSFPPGTSMLDSNQALSWIVFERDRGRFEGEFPGLRIERCEYLPWLGYLLSGGVNLRSAVPRPLTVAVAALDRASRPLDPLFAIHWHITIRKVAR